MIKLEVCLHIYIFSDVCASTGSRLHSDDLFCPSHLATQQQPQQQQQQQQQFLESTGEIKRSIMCSACQQRPSNIRISLLILQTPSPQRWSSPFQPSLSAVLSVWGIIKPCGTAAGLPFLSCQNLVGGRSNEIQTQVSEKRYSKTTETLPKDFYSWLLCVPFTLQKKFRKRLPRLIMKIQEY